MQHQQACIYIYIHNLNLASKIFKRSLTSKKHTTISNKLYIYKSPNLIHNLHTITNTKCSFSSSWPLNVHGSPGFAWKSSVATPSPRVREHGTVDPRWIAKAKFDATTDSRYPEAAKLVTMFKQMVDDSNQKIYVVLHIGLFVVVHKICFSIQQRDWCGFNCWLGGGFMVGVWKKRFFTKMWLGCVRSWWGENDNHKDDTFRYIMDGLDTLVGTPSVILQKVHLLKWHLIDTVPWVKGTECKWHNGTSIELGWKML